MRLIALLILMFGSPAVADDTLLPWYADDYEAAIADARSAGKPMVIDLWAPWCHTCLSMKNTVLADPSLASVAERFVWLALDTDKEINFAALEKFPPKVWPTFYVIGPDETVQAQLHGGATAKVFRAFLDRGYAGAKEGTSEEEGLAAGSPEYQVRLAERASLEARWADAEAAYERALAMAPAQWDVQARVRLERLSLLYKRSEWKTCLDVGSRDLDRAFVGHTPAAADFAYYLYACAKHLEDGPRRRAVLRHALRNLYRLFADSRAPLTIDDRSEALRIARQINLGLGQEPLARALGESQRLLLEQGVSQAKSPKEAMIYSWPRAEVYVWLGRGDELLDSLKLLVEALPEEYDPSYRLAWVLHALKRSREALGPITLAESLAYGPRRSRVLSLGAEIRQAAGDLTAAQKARDEVVELLTALPESRRPKGALDAAKKARAKHTKGAH